MAGGDELRPAIGTTPLPRPGEGLAIECGFEPAMVEFELVGAAPGEEVGSGAAHQALGWSHGTAIDTDGSLRQYVLHDAAAPVPGTVDAGGMPSEPGLDPRPGIGEGTASPTRSIPAATSRRSRRTTPRASSARRPPGRSESSRSTPE